MYANFPTIGGFENEVLTVFCTLAKVAPKPQLKILPNRKSESPLAEHSRAVRLTSLRCPRGATAASIWRTKNAWVSLVFSVPKDPLRAACLL